MTYNNKPIEYLAEYPNALPPGTKLKNGAYRVMNVLGQGSFGITYLAVTPEDQLFAIKEYFHKAYCERSADNSMSYSSNAEGAQEVIDGFRNFTNEAVNLTRIYSENQRRAETARSQQRHDLLAEENYNIVRVVESFEENKTSYLVMEYLDGGNLLQMLNKPMSEDMAVSIIIPIAWAVQHLHDNHIMHKDIKPDNIMMRSGNLLEPKLIDFGTTLHYDRSGKLTTKSIGAALGTDNYCSLEHSATSRLTPHLDVYSLGATLFHMVTGTPREPWGKRPQPDVVMEHLKDNLTKVNVSEHVRMAILQAMDNDPNKRTQTAREFIENLDSPYLPLGKILESPNGNRYRIIGVKGQEKDYLSYKAERLLKDAPIVNSGTIPIDKVNDGYIYSVHENFEKGLCRRDENQCVTSNRGHWPKQDYLAHVKENTGLVKIPSISTDNQGNPLAEIFTTNGTIYSVKRKKSGLSRLFSNDNPTNQGSGQKTKPRNNSNHPKQKNGGIVRFALFLVASLFLLGCGYGIWWILQPNYYIRFGEGANESYVFSSSGGTIRIPVETDAPLDKWDILLLETEDQDWITISKDNSYIEINCDKWELEAIPENDDSYPRQRDVVFCLMADCDAKGHKFSGNIHIVQSEASDEVTVLPDPIQKLLDDMVYVEGGSFMMGDSIGKSVLEDIIIDGDLIDPIIPDNRQLERPMHKVTLSSFYICKYEVTQAQWQSIMGVNPSYFSKGYDENLQRPVEQVSWNDCQAFITQLNRLTGKKFRLPTEAEWEYAARGGKKSCGYIYAGSNYPDSVAWFMHGTESEPTHAVGLKKPNELFLYDMTGNVSEWCQDWYGNYDSKPQTDPQGPLSGSEHVYRGSNILNTDAHRVTFRENDWNPAETNSHPECRVSNIGFRLLVLEP